MSAVSTITTPFIHPSAVVDEDVKIGDGTRIWHFTHLGKGCQIGARCSLGQNVYVAPGVRIGDNVKIQNNVSIYEGVELEDDVFCGPSMVFTNVVTPRSAFPRNSALHYARTVVRRGATIGANATIVCGNTIGQHGFVGAGAVVTHDVPDHAIVVGNPAKVIGYACTCGARLVLEQGGAHCSGCPRLYRLVDSRLQAK
jgi:UDP-2-acetamido-3-amino-2,3-dideoxy-glucuronate N-acetyltransferase